MQSTDGPYVVLICEDRLSEAVAEILLRESGKRIVSRILWNKDKIQSRIAGIHRSCRGQPYFVLTDQDSKANCPPKTVQRSLGNRVHPNLLYRFAVMEIESWVMAHRRALAKFLSVPSDKIPGRPDDVPEAKEYLIRLARRSRSSAIRRDLVPPRGSTTVVGPGYNDRLCEFVRQHWKSETAARHSPSLARTLRRLQTWQPRVA